MDNMQFMGQDDFDIHIMQPDGMVGYNLQFEEEKDDDIVALISERLGKTKDEVIALLKL